jgi:hypothetical protein
MPMKLNVGLARKVGLPEYSSLCASCSVEVELNGSMVFDDAEGFHSQVRQAFLACHQAVASELARQEPQKASVEPLPFNEPEAPVRNNGARNGAREASGGYQNGSGGGNGNGAHRASQKQLDYAQQLARGIRGLGIRRMETLAQKMFDKPLADLNSLDASGLIDMLKAIKSGEINLSTALEGVAT